MKPESEIAWHIARSDLGIIPNRYSPFIAINLPTRIFEYLAMGRPVVVPNTRGIRDYFGEKDVLFFKPDDPLDLARRITWVRQHPAETLDYVRRGRETYQHHLWHAERRRFLHLASSLLPSHAPSHGPASNPLHNGTPPS
jgi:glycosyltransferase involved in cell wall biosynthesis